MVVEPVETTVKSKSQPIGEKDDGIRQRTFNQNLLLNRAILAALHW